MLAIPSSVLFNFVHPSNFLMVNSHIHQGRQQNHLRKGHAGNTEYLGDHSHRGFLEPMLNLKEEDKSFLLLD